MIGLYKSYLRSAYPLDNSPKLVEPFISMNIICPTGRYDVNVEPAKDDVLFMDSEGFLANLGQFFRSVYGELQPKDDSSKASKQAASRSRGFERLLARKPQATKDLWLPVQLGNGESVGEEQTNTVRASQNLRLNPDTVLFSDVQLRDGTLAGPAEFRQETSQEKDEASEAEPSSEPGLGSNELPDNVQHDSNQKRTWRPNMYSDDYEQEDDLYDLRYSQQGPLASENVNEEEDLRDVNVSNPWTVAKLNAPIRTRPSDSEASRGRSSNGQLLTPGRQRGENSELLNTISRDRLQDATRAALGLPTPSRSQRLPSPMSDPVSSSSHPFPFPMKAWGKRDQSATSTSQKSLEGERYSAGALDTWVQRSLIHNPSALEDLDSSREDGPVKHDMLNDNSSRDFVSARMLPMDTPLSAITDVSQKPNRRPAPRKPQQNINKPFVSPVNDPDRVWFEMGPSRRTKPAQPPAAQTVREALAATAPIHYGSDDEAPTTEYSPASTARPSPKPMHPDLAVTMDYEMRKQAAMQKRKEFLRQQALDIRLQNQPSTDQIENVLPPTNSPHQNRYNAAVASLSFPNPTDATTTAGVASVLEDSDPRAYLLRVQRREEADRQSGIVDSGRRLKRRKTTMLPLETTPADATVQGLVLMIEISNDTIEGAVAKTSAWDDYVRAGRIGEGFGGLGIEDVRAWEGRVRELVEERFRFEGEEEVGVEVDLWSAVQGLMDLGVAAEG